MERPSAARPEPTGESAGGTPISLKAVEPPQPASRGERERGKRDRIMMGLPCGSRLP